MYCAFSAFLPSVGNGAGVELLCGFYHCFCQAFGNRNSKAALEEVKCCGMYDRNSKVGKCINIHVI